jgi:hypothetical protein
MISLTGHYWLTANDVSRLWLVVPALVMIQLGKDITSSIYVAARVSEKRGSGKEQ